MVEVVIPTYNNFEELKVCLLALNQQTYAFFKVWIVIDGSTDQTIEALPKLLPLLTYPCQILEHSDRKNHGRAATRNLVLPFIKGQYIWYLDSDMCTQPNTLSNHLLCLNQQVNAISVGGIHYLSVKKYRWARYLSTRGHQKYPHQTVIPFNYFVTANSVLPAHYVTELQGFDDNIARYGGEDMELAYRIQQRFQPIFMNNQSAIASTIQTKTAKVALKQLEEYGKYGLPYIFNKHPQFPKVYHLQIFDQKKWYHTLIIWATSLIPPTFTVFFAACLPFPLALFAYNFSVILAIFKGYRHK